MARLGEPQRALQIRIEKSLLFHICLRDLIFLIQGFQPFYLCMQHEAVCQVLNCGSLSVLPREAVVEDYCSLTKAGEKKS